MVCMNQTTFHFKMAKIIIECFLRMNEKNLFTLVGLPQSKLDPAVPRPVMSLGKLHDCALSSHVSLCTLYDCTLSNRMSLCKWHDYALPDCLSLCKWRGAAELQLVNQVEISMKTCKLHQRGGWWEKLIMEIEHSKTSRQASTLTFYPVQKFKINMSDMLSTWY